MDIFVGTVAVGCLCCQHIDRGAPLVRCAVLTTFFMFGAGVGLSGAGRTTAGRAVLSTIHRRHPRHTTSAPAPARSLTCQQKGSSVGARVRQPACCDCFCLSLCPGAPASRVLWPVGCRRVVGWYSCRGHWLCWWEHNFTHACMCDRLQSKYLKSLLPRVRAWC